MRPKSLIRARKLNRFRHFNRVKMRASMNLARGYFRHLILTVEAAEVDDLEAGAHVCIFGLWSPENTSIDGGL